MYIQYFHSTSVYKNHINHHHHPPPHTHTQRQTKRRFTQVSKIIINWRKLVKESIFSLVTQKTFSFETKYIESNAHRTSLHYIYFERSVINNKRLKMD
jgi:hypothetical protein